MALVTAHISWTDSPSSVGTLIEYKVQDTLDWIVPSSPPNPTSNDFYDLEVEENVYYDVRISSILTECGPVYAYFTIFKSSNNCCPPDMELSPDGSYCFLIDEVPATPPLVVENAVAVQHASYSTCGTYIYEPGYNSDGTGPSHRIPTSNTFWVNGVGICADSTTTAGPLNRTGLWSTSILNNQDIGFGICVDSLEDQTLLIGLGTDNYGVVKLDSSVIIQQNPSALATQYGIGTLATFKVWHVYPVFVPSGPHFIEILGHNDSGPASLGCEIYDITAADLISITSYEELGNRLIFSSKDQRNKPIQLGTNGIGYSCPATYSLASCADPIVCQKVITIPCTTSTTTTSSTTLIPPTTTTTTTSSTTTTSTTVLCPTITDLHASGYNDAVSTTGNVRFGTSVDNIVTVPEILAGFSKVTDIDNDIVLNWGTSGSPTFYWFAVPSISSSAIKNHWFEATDNQGSMLSPADLFNAPTTLLVAGVLHQVYITQYATIFTVNDYTFSIV